MGHLQKGLPLHLSRLLQSAWVIGNAGGLGSGSGLCWGEVPCKRDSGRSIWRSVDCRCQVRRCLTCTLLQVLSLCCYAVDKAIEIVSSPD